MPHTVRAAKVKSEDSAHRRTRADAPSRRNGASGRAVKAVRLCIVIAPILLALAALFVVLGLSRARSDGATVCSQASQIISSTSCDPS